MKITPTFILIILLTLGAGFFVGVAVYRFTILPYSIFCNPKDLHHINPELICDSQSHLSQKETELLHLQVEDLIKDKISDKKVSEVAVYFKDFRNGPSFGINEHTQFSPASLLKLPLLMAYYRLAEEKPNLLQTELVFKGKANDLVQEIAPSVPLIENTSYTVDTLLTHMIQYSDNNAYYLLLAYLEDLSPNKNLLLETYNDLGIIDPKGFLDETISVKSYTTIFNKLYDGFFFQNKETSEKVLDLLTQTDFHKGLRAGIPESIEVAHKFGEREGFGNNVKQLHDCGIVYYPKRPYLLCVMTRGIDSTDLADTIASISKIVYEGFDSH